MPFNFENALPARQRMCGLHRAAFWRQLGFPNLVLARKARWKGHLKKSQRPRELEIDSPFAIDGKRPRGF
jgi:hypothetical protein